MIKDPTHADIYKALGLDELDSFAPDAADMGRPLGASTWMCIRAVYLMKVERQNVTLVCPTQDRMEQHRLLVLRYSNRLMLADRGTHGNITTMSNGKILRLHKGDERVVNIVGHMGVVLNELLWAERLKRRVRGPFDMIRTIRKELGEYHAVAEDNELLMTLSLKGAIEMVQANPQINIDGWTMPFLDRIDVTSTLGVEPP